MVSRRRILGFAIGKMLRQDGWAEKYNPKNQFHVNQYDYSSCKEYLSSLREKWQDYEDPECEFEDYVDVSKYSNYEDYAYDVDTYRTRLEWRDELDCDCEFDVNPCDFEYKEYYVKELKRAWKKELDENYEVVGNITQLVCGAFAAEASRKNIELNKIVNVEHKHIITDSTKMQEILSNLISNAIKYTPEGGKVLIDVQELPYNKEGYTLIQTKVSDTGIGMSEEFLPSLFELFTRERNTTLSKIPGTGLGIAIVKNLVDLMNGSIEVESELGKGSTFTITIPHKIANKDYTNRNIESSNEFDIDFKGKRILLAEDNELNAEITTTILSEMGFEVKAVEDGILCVNEMQHQPANTYDLILMDIQMPNMDGYKATDCIRHLSQSEKANMPIIAMSANAFEEDKKKAFDVKMNDYITKPIDFQKMEEVLKHVLSKKDPLS